MATDGLVRRREAEAVTEGERADTRVVSGSASEENGEQNGGFTAAEVEEVDTYVK